MQAIEYLEEYRFTPQDLASLDEDLAAGLSITCHAANEVNTLRRLYLFSCHDFLDKEPIDNINAIQRSVLLRIWSAKLFEFVKFVKSKDVRNSKNLELQELIKTAKASYDELERNNDFKMARDLRNEATNHYGFKPAKKNLKHISNDSNMSFYIHRMNGNNFFPLGEEVMFTARIKRHVPNSAKNEVLSESFKGWLNWNNEVTKWLSQVNLDFIGHIIETHFPDRKPRKRSDYLPCEMVGEIDEIFVPLFARTDKDVKTGKQKK